MTPHELSNHIKAEAKRLGFTVCGISRATAIATAEAAKLRTWVGEGKHGQMSYLERNSEKRENPAKLVDGCRSIVSVALSYAQGEFDEGRLHISRYAQGADYHRIVKDKLYSLLQSIRNVAPVQGRAFCDTAPVAERYWAVQAGLGWIGRNHQLIIPQAGSYFFLGELMLDCELEYDRPFTQNLCGTCTNCIKNCPTGALAPNDFDARKCLSYLTIEHRSELPKNLGEKMGNCFYGCDKCQTNCPWNKKAQRTEIAEFRPSEELATMRDEDWAALTQEKYNELFGNSAVERAGYTLLMRNIEAITKK